MAVRAQNIQLPKMRHPLVRADGHGTELADREDASAGINMHILRLLSLKHR